MGVVYLVRRLADRELYAIKTIRPVRGTSTREIELFLRECQILKSLRHPAIVAFHEFGHTGQWLYLVMDYVLGTDASRLLKEHGILPVPLGVNLICQALAGLQYAHEQGFVHRDLKPANLLVAGDGSSPDCRLADFGLARKYHASRVSGLTLLGDMGGTVAYMAPEQITDFRNAQPAADIYSTAATLYHLLTGKYAFDFAQAGGPGAAEEDLDRIADPHPHAATGDSVGIGRDHSPRPRSESTETFCQRGGIPPGAAAVSRTF